VKVYLNGAIVDEEEALLPVQDRGVLFGDGVFETIRAYEGRPFRLDRHLARLREGCQVLRLTGIPGDAELEEAIASLYRENVGSGDAYVRITVTGGLFDGTRTLARPFPPNVFVVVTPFEGYPPELYRRGLRVTISATRRNESSPLSRIKTTNYLDSLYARQEAREREYDDAVFLNTAGYLAEGSTSNLFLARGERLCTPRVDCGILPGITREAVLELCEKLGVATEEGFYSPDELLSASEAFLTMSTGEVVPIAEVDDSPLGSGCPGPLTSRLAQAYRDLVREELSL
jgi:branched-subunit amino acid aminotransferase/4-amino-4-deoxychorismate lyase